MTININNEKLHTICKSIKKEQLKSVKSVLFFVGHAHSGHSIIGSILDAHSQIALANEVNIAKLIRDKKLSEVQIQSVLLYYSYINNKNDAWNNSEYKHKLINTMQGKTKFPEVIGDKKAGGTTRIICNNPWILDYLLELFGSKLKFVFVKRNPLDIVAAYSYYMKQPICQFHVDRYLENFNTTMMIKDRMPSSQFITINQKKFINSPHQCILDLLTFFNINTGSNEVSLWVENVKNNIAGKSSTIKIPNKYIVQLHEHLK